MTKREIIIAGIAGWIVVHVGLVLAGAAGGLGVDQLLHGGGDDLLHCQEDEVAIHGGIDNWYDPALPLECVNFDEFPEIYGGSNTQAYDDGFNDGANIDWEQWRAETYHDGFQEGYNEGQSDAANTPVIGEAWSTTPAPLATDTATPTPAPTPEPEVKRTQMTVALTFYTCPPFCPGDPMYNGAPLHTGAVACGWALVDGQVFKFDGETYTCEDRGGSGNAYWVDFWMPDYTTGIAWQDRVGTVGKITLLVPTQ